MPENIEIAVSKRKAVPFVLGSAFFVLAGLMVLFIGFGAKGQILLQIFFIALGLVCVLFFGLIAVVMVSKLFSHKPGLIISDKGLTDFSSGVSAGFIAWGEIKKITFSNSGNNTFLIVITTNPEKFINRQTNPVKKLAMWMNYKISGSPIHILASLLDIDLPSLHNLIADKRFGKTRAAGRE